MTVENTFSEGGSKPIHGVPPLREVIKKNKNI